MMTPCDDAVVASASWSFRSTLGDFWPAETGAATSKRIIKTRGIIGGTTPIH